MVVPIVVKFLPAMTYEVDRWGKLGKDGVEKWAIVT
jgi:hypothetical protein